MAKVATKSVTNTFTKGMNVDLDKSVRPNSTYLHASNIRVVSTDSDTSGAIENVKGNVQIIDNGNDDSNGIPTGQYIIGTKKIDDWLVVWTTSNTALGTAGSSNIFAFKIKDGVASTDPDTALYPGTLGVAPTGYPFCIYNDSSNNLAFSTIHRIKAIASYESTDVAKLYWTDGNNNLRWINIFDSDMPTQAIDRFDVIPNATFDKPSISSLISGSLKAGSIQYTYQLYKSKGSETLFAPPSDVINITTDNENLGDSQYYEGSEHEDDTGKGVRISIDNTNTGYNFIRGIAIQYEALNTIPDIRVFEERAIDSTGSSTINLNDIGETLGTYELEELTVLNRSLFTAQDLEAKDGYLFAANIEENYFDIGTWDARSYRFLSGTKTCELQEDETDTKYYECDVSSSTIETSTWTSVGSTPVTLSGDPITDIPETANCINYFNNYDNDTPVAGTQYKCQFNSTTLGSSGYNIDIGFTTFGCHIDDDITRFDHESVMSARPHYQVTESETDNTSYTGYASPYISSQYMGYMRDEAYRFGIVFYDNKGQRSYVRWVCDLRMPTQEEEEITSLSGGTDVQAEVLIPTFEIKNGLPAGAIAYQIVRVKRESTNDRNILAQGLLTSTRLLSNVEYPEFLEDSDADANDTNEYVYLNSPEVSFNKNLSYGSGDKLVAISKTTIELSISAVANTGTGCRFSIPDTTGLVAGDTVLIWGTTNYNGSHLVDNIFSITQFDVDPLSYVSSQSGKCVKRGALYKNTGQGANITISKISDWEGHTLSTTSIDPIDNCIIVSPGEATYNLGGSNSITIWDPTLAKTFFKGTSLLVKHSGSGSWFPANTSNSDNYRFLCNYRRNNWLSQYGGNDYEDRARNIYQATGSIETAIGSDNVYGGDTYICYFDYFNLISDLSGADDDYETEGVMFPVETSINCNLRYDTSSLNKLLPTTNSFEEQRIEMTQETGGIQYDNEAPTPREYDQKTSLYLYNTVYSQENTTIPFVAKPVDSLYSISEKFITRVKYSDRKIDGAVSDSWFKFRSNNFLDLEKEYGPVNNIKVYKNSLHFWQDQSFGVLSINPRALLSTEEGTGLVLGTGGFLDRADYITKHIGNTNRFGIVGTDQSLYWINNDHKEMIQFTAGVRGTYSLSSKLRSLSFEKGMSSYLQRLGIIADAQLAYDKINGEIFVTISEGRSGTVTTANGANWVEVDATGITDGNFVTIDNKQFYVNDYDTGPPTELELLNVTDYFLEGDTVHIASDPEKTTFSFLENLDIYNGFYSITPGMYNDDFEYIMTTISPVSSQVWTHNKGNRGQFYNTYYPSVIYTTFNPEYTYTKVFDNLLWYSEVRDESGANDIIRFSDTWDKATFWNDYQQSTEQTFGFRTGELPYDRRDRGFSTALPRNAVDINVSSNPNIWTETDTTQTYRERLKDKYLNARFDYTNSLDNYRFVCPYITVKYRHSIR